MEHSNPSQADSRSAAGQSSVCTYKNTRLQAWSWQRKKKNTKSRTLTLCQCTCSVSDSAVVFCQFTCSVSDSAVALCQCTCSVSDSAVPLCQCTCSVSDSAVPLCQCTCSVSDSAVALCQCTCSVSDSGLKLSFVVFPGLFLVVITNITVRGSYRTSAINYNSRIIIIIFSRIICQGLKIRQGMISSIWSSRCDAVSDDE